jgi:hypothetical protein
MTDIGTTTARWCSGRPKLATARGSFDRCRKTSFDLAGHLRSLGHDPVVVRLSEGLRDWPDADPRWLKLTTRSAPSRSHHWTHYAVLCDGSVVDGAYRQFDPAAEHPRVVSLADVRAEWGSVEAWDANGPRDMPETATGSRDANTTERERGMAGTTLLTRVSADFDAGAFKGVLVASEDLEDTYGFTEEGYDTCDYQEAPNVLEIELTATKLADGDDVRAAAERAGVQLWLTKDEYLKYWPGAKESEWAEKEFPTEETEANQLLENEKVVAELEAAGFDGFRDYVVVGADQPTLTCLWKADSFRVIGPVEVVADDPDEPYQVSVAGAAPKP